MLNLARALAEVDPDADVLAVDPLAPRSVAGVEAAALVDAAIKNFEDMYTEFLTPSLKTPKLRRPRQGELPSRGLWFFQRRKRNDLVHFRHLGVNLVIFDELCKEMRKLCPEYDHDVVRRGHNTRLDYIDLTALLLRRLQLYGPKWLEILENEYAANATVVRRALHYGRPRLLQVLKATEDAAVRHPTLKEAMSAWEGFKAQHGAPPWYRWAELRELPPPVEGMDGTTTPVLRNGNQHKASETLGGKGNSLNHVLGTFIGGTITDYSGCVYGSFNDSRCSVDQLARFLSKKVNPHGLALALDNGWTFPFTVPLPDQYKQFREYNEGDVLRMRPLKDGETAPVAELKSYYEECSAYITVFRQHGEWTNGGLKRQFPILMNPVRVALVDYFTRDFEPVRTVLLKRAAGCMLRSLPLNSPPPPPLPISNYLLFSQCVRLFNLRSRRIGWNQVRTTYMRHSDANFKEQLKYAKNCDEYLKLVAEKTSALKQELYGGKA